MRYPQQAKELLHLLEMDQDEKKAVGRAYFYEDQASLEAKQAALRQKTQQRTAHMLEILEQIGEPSISNIGAKAAQAVSVLAVHGTREVLEQVLELFNRLYERSKNDTYYQAIPSMTDRILLLDHKPQRFGTQWLFDDTKQPFMPPVEDFEHVNERRAEYGIEPLRWPKSLAIPESEQLWLQRPLFELVMRQPTPAEYEEFAGLS